MAPPPEALPRFAFSRRDPTAILALAEKRRRQGGGVRVLALGGQPRDRIYCAQLLADVTGQAFAHIDLTTPAATLADEKTALERMPEANLACISVPGRYAGKETRKALQNGLHVFLFSDHVDLETEAELKRLATKQGLLLMGPECGTAIISGVPLV